MRVHVRYETPDENGETRRERNKRFEQDDETPEFELPDEGAYLWDIYWDISNRVQRVHDGVCLPIPPSEFLAWSTLTSTFIYPDEYAILCAIDDEFCSSTGDEIAAYRARQEAQRQTEAGKPKQRR